MLASTSFERFYVEFTKAWKIALSDSGARVSICKCDPVAPCRCAPETAVSETDIFASST